jgi:glutathione S-transferase
MRLIVGNMNYSSWSMRAWLPLRHFGLPFEEERVALFESGYKERILAVSPAGKVPVLVDGTVTVWDSLAIGEYLAEKYPTLGLWPGDPAQRAAARSVSAEMHAGFARLRTHMPMNIRGSYPGQGHTADVAADIARIRASWAQCLARSGGPFLFGEFGLADAMYAPVVSRFRTYGVRLDGALEAYADRLWQLPAVQAWCAAALAETEYIDDYEPYR